MECEIDNIFQKAGRNNHYQFTSLLLFFILYGTSEYLVIILPFLEVKPIVNFRDEYNNYHSSLLNHTICTNYVFEIAAGQKKSLVIELGIFCDKKLTILLVASLFFGCMIGSIITYKFADKLGRKKTIILFTFINVCIQFSFYFIKEYILINIWFFMSGFTYTIIILTIIVYIIELVDKNDLAVYMSIIFSSFYFFGILYTIFFYYVENWRILFLIIGTIDFLLIFPIYYYLEESPTFYFANGEFKMFFITMMNIAKKSGRKLNEEDFVIDNKNEVEDLLENVKKDNLMVNTRKSSSSNSDKLQNNDCKTEKFIDIDSNYDKLYINRNSICVRRNCTQNISQENDKSEDNCDLINTPTVEKYKNDFFNNLNKKSIRDFNLLDLIRYDAYRTSFLVLCFLWITTAIIIYGITINMKNIQNNLYTNSIIIFSFEIIFSLTAGFVSNTYIFGRKRTLILLLLLSFISFMMFILYEHLPESFLFRACLFTSRISCTSLLCVVYFYTNEIYPAVIRTKGLGMNSAVSKLAGIVAHILIEGANIDTIVLILILLNIFAIIFSFELPETIKKQLKTHIEIKNKFENIK